MIFSDEDLPRKPAPLFTPAKIDGLGATELAGYIAALEAEIIRAREAVARLDAHKAAAALFFKKPDQA
ncbi:DUF1192 domain-containing protein [Acidocella sp.]|uniref:DUF1192 domain-containing protein n=1 Tax=Acidocella sp. TaxID=50710 RepID=UPI0026276B7D|nr:DUF1192 domain-containing protein [Acidocella sp.]